MEDARPFEYLEIQRRALSWFLNECRLIRKGHEYVPRLYPVTTLAQSVSVTEGVTLHWKEYVMESTELGALMLCTCIGATLTYSDESPLRSLGLSAGSNSILMGIAVAVTTFMIIPSPFGADQALI
jgi:hypothetical protein